MTNIWRVQTVWTGLPGAPYLSTHYFLADSTTPASCVDAVGDALELCENGMINNLIWETSPDVALLDTVTGNVTDVQVVTPRAGQGANTGNSLPRQAQGLITLTTDQFVSGRRVKGRMFFPGLSAADLTDTGQMTPAIRNMLTTAFQPMADLSSPEWVVWSRKALDAFPVTSVSVAADFGTLNGRRD